MNKRMRLIAISLLLLTLAITPLVAFAGQTTPGDDTTNDVTLTFPENMTACAPTFHFSTAGVDSTWTVEWKLSIQDGDQSTKIAGGTTTGNLDVTYTPAPLADGETRIYHLFVIVSDADGSPIEKLEGKWQVDCEQVVGGEGCTPGFWRNHLDLWPIDPATDFDTTFGRDAFDPNITMEEAVNLGGGGLNALSRHAAAAYLNAGSPDVDYDLTAAEVVAKFQMAFDSGDYDTIKDEFEAFNEQGCEF